MATSLQTRPAVNPDDPLSAKQIVTEYARVLNRDLERGIFPVAIDSLPFAKPTIKTAIETSLLALVSTGQLTEELREFLETAYVSLADYVPADLVQLMREYSRAGDDWPRIRAWRARKQPAPPGRPWPAAAASRVRLRGASRARPTC